MAIRINNWGGVIVWYIRKHFSTYTSQIALKGADILYRKKIKHYIEWFMDQSSVPLFRQVMLETMNRCNGKCSFCPANVNDEKREFKKMSDTLIDKIIAELVDMHFQGNIFLSINNEPFLDIRILSIAKKVKKFLPKSKICLITNGTLLTEEKMKTAATCIDEMIINNYSNNYKLNSNIKAIYKFVRHHKKDFKNIHITINRRYLKEILATRAGSAPNKQQKNITLDTACIYPYTDLTIFPDGEVGLCCNDCYEVTSYGNVKTESLRQIWTGTKYTDFRKQMMSGRMNCDFCQKCDVVDAGSREKII